MLAHIVFFTLKDSNEANRTKLVEVCNRYLAAHPGVVFYCCGPREDSLDREVNDTEFDVALHLIFDSKSSHDTYQDAPTHLKFIDECKDMWANVRVFDSIVETVPPVAGQN